MKSFKSNMSVFLPLFILLFSFEFSFNAKNIVKNYEMAMNQDYNIIVVSKNDINETILKKEIYTFQSANKLTTDSILDKLKEDISSKNLSILKNSLPNFYSIKLNSFPSTKYMNEIKSKLLKIDGVTRVETFSKTHDKIYKFLLISKYFSYIFTSLITLIGLMLIYKQMKIWIYEHQERIDIMSLFGAAFWLKGGSLYKMVFISSLLSSAFVIIFFVIIFNLENVKNVFFELAIMLPDINILHDFFILFGTSLALTLIAVSFVMIKTSRSSV
ncbi:cell division protein FtsX [Campylobacter sp. RM12327]|uniref:cell division protein FtsX n=1 Tax=Campylobacter sputorum TaxID=206 RepID=UPI00053C0065|nr:MULTISPECIES: cell division protein FtsX [Campylobacter]ASM40235.1 cell division protein FtsX [Campylobacter sputorum]MBE7358523.1 cell division protein FtsX [Campylobacter sp. RM11302]MBF6669766.1 cell division protein FtsX [Campylobacter sp. RM12327]MBF6674946.1 cell division protein FtsX [Campylobacter sp. RM13538]MBF6676354.1 cell division protein FtsX [Campylobacter sp. RM12321]